MNSTENSEILVVSNLKFPPGGFLRINEIQMELVGFFCRRRRQRWYRSPCGVLAMHENSQSGLDSIRDGFLQWIDVSYCRCWQLKHFYFHPDPWGLIRSNLTFAYSSGGLKLNHQLVLLMATRNPATVSPVEVGSASAGCLVAINSSSSSMHGMVMVAFFLPFENTIFCNEKTQVGWGHVGDDTTQLHWDYFINHEIRIPINQPGFNGK